MTLLVRSFASTTGQRSNKRRMSDIFISYASEDKPRAAALAEVFGARGWSVWWDASIPPGKEYDEVIQEALNAARCVVVLWSQHSADSRWVRTEAEEGANREILVPALLEDTAIPLAFRRIQAAHLIDWDGDATHPGVSQLVETISGLLGRAPAASVVRKTSRWSRTLLLFAPTALAGICLPLLMVWRVPTRIHMEITVDRAEFTVGPAQAQFVPILSTAEFTSLAVERFATIDFEPETLEVADQDAVNLDVQIRETAWKAFAPRLGKVSLTAGEDRLYPAVTFEAAEALPRAAGRLDSVTVAPGSGATLERSGGRIIVTLAGAKSRAIVATSNLIHMIVDHSTIAGHTQHGSPAPTSVYRTLLRPDNSLIEINGGPESLVMSLKLAASQATPLLANGVPVSSLDFTQLDAAGNRVTSVHAGGSISYPAYSTIKSVFLQPRTFIGLDDLENFYLSGVVAASDGLRVQLDGIAGRVMTEADNRRIDHRLTVFDTLWHRPRLAILLALVLWLLPTMAGAFLAYSKRKRL